MTRIAARCCLFVTALISALALLSACSDGSSISATGLVYCSEGSPESFNPQIATSGTSFDASAHMLYDRLVQRENGVLVPALASAWQISDQGRVYDFTLRHDIRFHHTDWFAPGRYFNSDDVVFSFARQQRESHPFHLIGGGQYTYFNSTGLASLLLTVEAVSEDHVRFRLREASPQFLTLISMEFASILSAEYAGQLLKAGTPEKIDNLPVGTGPFQLKRFEHDEFIRYTANANYFQGRPALDNVVFAITPDPSLRLARVRAGECDVMAQPSPAHIALITKDPQLQVLKQSGLNVGYWAFNTHKPPLDDVRVRRALNLAINRKAILDSVYFGAAELARGPLPPIIAGYNPQLTPYEYDPEAAKKLLDEAGYKNGFSLDIWAMPVSRPYNPNARKMAELMQEDLRRIGVKASIVSYEWTEFLHRTRQGQHMTALLGWTGDINDADNFLSPLLSCNGARAGSNRAFWCDPGFDNLLNLARQGTDEKQREMIFREAQNIFREQAPWAPLAHGIQFLVVRKNVRGVVLTDTGSLSLRLAEKLP